MSNIQRIDPQPQARAAIPCANPACGAIINDPSRVGTWSFILTLATRGGDSRLGSFQCPPIEQLQAGHLDAQHFCCSPACLRAILLPCFDEDIMAIHKAEVAALAALDAEKERQYEQPPTNH